MKQVTLERRLEILKLEGMGFSEFEIVKDISKRFQCTKRNVYLDFQSKAKWQPQLQKLSMALQTVLNRHEQIYRKAAFMYLKSRGEKERLAALNIMRSVNHDYFSMLQSTGQISKLPEKVIMNVELAKSLVEYEEALEKASQSDLRSRDSTKQMDSP